MIYINGRFLTQPLTGVNRFAYELCLALLDIGLEFTLICPCRNFYPEYNVDNFCIRRYGVGNSHFWEQICLPFFFLNRKYSVLISFTGLGSVFVRKKIMTIHDLAYLENPKWYSISYYYYYKMLTPIAAGRSMIILTVSEFSKKEISQKLNLPENKIHVVYNAVNILTELDFSNIVLSKRYVLAVSSLDPRKNLARLVKAMSHVKTQEVKLFIVGSANKVFATVDEKDLDSRNVELLGRVSDDELKRLYSNAIAFIFPSLYEGFGLPPIEAMSFGCPVIASDIPVMREICGDAVLYVNPSDEIDIALKIDMLLGSNNLIMELRQRGFVQITKYSWKKSALQLEKLLRDILQ